MKRIISGDPTDAVSELERENAEVAYRAALESFVLLRNNGALPLKEKEVALFGAGAVHTIKGGTGSGETNNRHNISIYEGLRMAGIKISTEKWLNEYAQFERKAHEKWLKENKGIPSEKTMGNNYSLPFGRLIGEADISESDRQVAIYVVARQSGEAGDKKIEKGDFNLMPTEISDLNFLHEHFDKVVLVINSGSSMDITGVEGLDLAIVYYGQAGQEGGRAFGEVLTGKHSFSGKLTSSWVKTYADIPFGSEFSYLNNDLDNEYYKEGIYVGYRYFDTFGVSPRFPFGFGLSYADFSISSTEAELQGRAVSLVFNVRNTGKCNGKETVQIYAALPSGRLDKEYQRLVAFKKTKELAPGESEDLQISFDLSALASYDQENSCYLLEKGDYLIKAGNSSADNKGVLVINAPQDIVISRHDGICPMDAGFEQLKNDRVFNHVVTGIKRARIDPKDVVTVTYQYGRSPRYSDEKVDAILDRLNTKELIDVCTGIGMMGMLDTNAFCTPGVAGKTTYKLMNKGLLSVTLADGPTGLRLLRRAAISPKGMIKMFKGDYLLSFLETLPGWMLAIIKPRKRDTVFYQHATAFPVGTNLAQSWNEKLVEEVGYAVSREMDRYNVTYWLAPGMNIQRNPLCGRNFEYYSEDPLVTGKIAAAMTRGVQKISGNYTTIKHFACNNTEDNRHYSNSHVSERALREIYLKGFEINIREAGSRSLMTSYNLINGIYSPDSYDLCTKVLRNEWGFDGVVMTDWSSTTKDQGDSALAIAAGNDLIMPGDCNEIREIRRGLKRGTVTVDDLKWCAANIIRSIVYSNVAKKYDVSDFLDEKGE